MSIHALCRAHALVSRLPLVLTQAVVGQVLLACWPLHVCVFTGTEMVTPNAS